MIKIKLADKVFAIENSFDYLNKQCALYITEETEDFYIKVSLEEILQEKELSKTDYNLGYYESLCAYRKICEILPKYDTFLMHSAIIEMDGKAIAFLAQSGVGKSTHISNWRKRFADRVKIINGDKPLIRFDGERIYACGTPWAGKENWNRNVEAELEALVFLQRGEVNEVEEIVKKSECVEKLFKQVYLPQDTVARIKTLELMDSLLEKNNCYNLYCNIDEESAEVAYQVIGGKK